MRIQRRGFSLIEVMVAMSICLFGLTLLLQMTSLAQRYAQRSVELAEEQVICQNILNEICVGTRGWTPVTLETCEQNPEYEFSISSEPHAPSGLLLVEVAVRRADSPTRSAQEPIQAGNNNNSENRVPREFRLARLIRAQIPDLDSKKIIPADLEKDLVPE